ncbi:MAG: XRE family transcriptional regulator [Chloroflexota bacterium]
MDSGEFSRTRRYLGRTQEQLAQLLSVSPKAIQSFEQGWRNIPAYVERQLLFLLFLKRPPLENTPPCWEIRRCPTKTRRSCVAWELGAGHFCWFVNGTLCHGKAQKNWRDKIELCRQCEVFRAMVTAV